jgi:hypothetical protein
VENTLLAGGKSEKNGKKMGFSSRTGRSRICIENTKLNLGLEIFG